MNNVIKVNHFNGFDDFLTQAVSMCQDDIQSISLYEHIEVRF